MNANIALAQFLTTLHDSDAAVNITGALGDTSALQVHACCKSSAWSSNSHATH